MKPRRRTEMKFISDPRTRQEIARDEKVVSDFERSFAPDGRKLERAQKRMHEIYVAKEEARARLLSMSPLQFTFMFVQSPEGWIAREPLLALEAVGLTAAQAAHALEELIDEQIKLDPIAVLATLTAERTEVKIKVRPA